MEARSPYPFNGKAFVTAKVMGLSAFFYEPYRSRPRRPVLPFRSIEFLLSPIVYGDGALFFEFLTH